MGTPADRLKAARVAAGFTSARQAAEALGISADTYTQHENGTRGFPANRAQRYATFFHTTPEHLLYGRGAGNHTAALSPRLNETLTRLPLNTLSVRHQVQAGMWFEADMLSQVEDGPSFPVVPHPSFATSEQWLERVVGDSMNLMAPEGSFVHVVSMIGSGAYPKQDALVIVERIRAGGHLRERTIKQVNITPGGGIELWPRSTNPKWSEPLKIHEDTDTPEAVTVEIVGLVIGRYQSFI